MAAGDASNYRLFTAGTAVASIDIRANGVLQSISLTGWVLDAASASTYVWEVSFIEAGQAALNDTTSVIATLTLSASSDLVSGSLLTLPDTRVFAGERLYLVPTRTVGSSDDARCHATLTISDKVMRASRARR